MGRQVGVLLAQVPVDAPQVTAIGSFYEGARLIPVRVRAIVVGRDHGGAGERSVTVDFYPATDDVRVSR